MTKLFWSRKVKLDTFFMTTREYNATHVLAKSYTLHHGRIFPWGGIQTRMSGERPANSADQFSGRWFCSGHLLSYKDNDNYRATIREAEQKVIIFDKKISQVIAKIPVNNFL